MRPSLRTITLALATTATAASPVLWSSSAGAAGELYVATTGLDSNPGTAAAPLRSVQAAVTKATPGTTIKIQPGTYTGAIKIKTSGTAAAPIRITAVTPGTVQLT
ncbi:MAG TPA: chondroitinase-B domain-containing protein, partial [Tetrasphaera sp.]|nr:chondroitinase-B domain-containing protein [Tetrasphaera sp.]